MENTGKFNLIPRLSLSSKRESWDLNSARSDFEDLFNSTFRGDAEENVGSQIERLNTILETVLTTINNEEVSSILKPTDLTIEPEKIYLDSSTQTSLGLKSLEYQEKRIKELENLQFPYQSSSPATLISNFQSVVESFLEESYNKSPNSSFNHLLNEILQSVKVFSEPVADYSFKLDYSNMSSILQGPSTSVELYRKHLEYLSSNISNLTSTPITFTGTYPELEVPDLVNSITAEFSKVKCKEKEIELKETKEDFYDFCKKLQTTCTFEDLLDLNENLQNSIKNLESTGEDSDFKLKIGKLELSLLVYFPEEFKAQHFQPSFEWTDLIPDSTQEANSCNWLSDLNFNPQPPCTILELTEKLEETQNQLADLRLLYQNMQSASQFQVQELESKIEDLMFQIEIKDKILKTGHKQIGLKNYVDKLQELREKELKLRSGHEKLEYERQKLLQQTFDYFCCKDKIDSKHEKSILKKKTQSKSDASVSTFTQSESKSSQTDEDKLEETYNLDQLNQLLQENYCKLEDLPENSNAESIFENIKRIKKQINEIHTKQALIYTERSIDYAESKLKLIEKELKKSKLSKAEEQELESTRRLNQMLAKDLEDLKVLFASGEINLDQERGKLVRDRISLQQQQEEFVKKREMLKDKIFKVNQRQKKLVEMEEALNEKKTQILVQAKKQECFKQAVEEEWAKIACKRMNVVKCQKMIDDEWKNLVRESEAFENLKRIGDGGNLGNASCAFQEKQKNMLEKLSQIEENALKVEKQRNQVESMKKRMEEDGEKLKEEWKRLEKEKRDFDRKQQDLEVQLQILNKEKTVLKENRFYINSLVPKFKNLF